MLAPVSCYTVRHHIVRRGWGGRDERTVLSIAICGTCLDVFVTLNPTVSKGSQLKRHHWVEEQLPPAKKAPQTKVAAAAQQRWGFGFLEVAPGGSSSGRRAVASAVNTSNGSGGGSSGLNPFLHPEVGFLANC